MQLYDTYEWRVVLACTKSFCISFAGTLPTSGLCRPPADSLSNLSCAFSHEGTREAPAGSLKQSLMYDPPEELVPRRHNFHPGGGQFSHMGDEHDDDEDDDADGDNTMKHVAENGG